MYVRNLSGVEYVLQATTTHDSEISGNQTLSLTILPTKANLVFIADIAEMWVITDDDDVAHKVVYAKRQGVGDMLTVDIKAVPLFFDDFDNLRVEYDLNQHMTAMAAFTLIFADTGYNFVLHDSHDSLNWEGFGKGGDETKLETFKRALNRYGAEFEIYGNTIHLKALIGRDTQFQYRHRLNASNITQEIDASGFWTYAKGYGDFGETGGDGEAGGSDWQDAKLIPPPYISPLAAVIGERHAPPIKDGRVKDKSVLEAAMKKLVDNSLKVSVTTDIHELRKQGYALAQPQLGDRVFLTDERIGFDEEVRVVAMSITKDWRGNVTHFSITIGDEGVTKRHMSGMKTAIDNITNLIAGTQKLPNSVLSNAILQATTALQNAQTELTFGTNGILAIDKLDPNNVTILNSSGIGVSTDGGATFKNAITGAGVVAETIVGNSIFGVNITSADHRGYFHVNGANAEFYDTSNNRKVNIGPSGLYGYNAGGDIRFQADATLVTSSALGTSNANVYLAAQKGFEARVVDIAGIPGDGLVDSYDYLPLRARGFYGNYLNVNPSAANAINLYLRPLSVGEVKITVNETTDVFRDLRARGIFANTYDFNTDTSGTNMYIRPTAGTEVRFTTLGSTTNYNTGIRTGIVYAEAIEVNALSGSAQNLYLRTVNNGWVNVTNNGTTDEWRGIQAREFKNMSSRALKTNIELFKDSGLAAVNDLTVVSYDLKDDIKNGVYAPQVGLIAEDSPRVNGRGDGTSVDLYKLAIYNTRAIQEVDAKVNDVSVDVNWLKMECQILRRKVEKLEGVS